MHGWSARAVRRARGGGPGGRGSRGLRLLLVASMLAGWVPAWHALGLGITGQSTTLTTPFIGLGSMNGRQLVLDVLTGRRLVVPDATPVIGRVPMTPAAQAELAGGLITRAANRATAHNTPAGANSATVNATRAGATNPLLPHNVVPATTTATVAPTPAAPADGWDPKLAGARNSVFYPPTRITHGPGTVTTLLGGRCDGLPGPQTSVTPGNVVVDHAGRVFWVDVGSNLHAQSGIYVRTLDRSGRVRTLGNLNGPMEGRLFRGYGTLESTDVRIVADQQGGVYFTFNRPIDYGHPAGGDWQAEDVPAGAPAIGRLRADGGNEFVAGALDLPTGRHDGGPLAGTAFDNIAAMASDADGNLYVADSNPIYVADSSSSGYAGGQASAPSNGRFGTDQPGYQATTLIRFLNRSKHPVTFFAGTAEEITIAAGRVGTIAGGSATSAGLTDTTYGTTPSPMPGDAAVGAPQAHIPFVAGMVVGPAGLTLLASSEVYRGIGINGPTVWITEGSAVYLLGVNTSTGSAQMSGTTVDSGTVAALGGGAPGYAGDNGPVRSAQFNVRDHDGWFYGDLAPDGHGGLLVADTYNDAVRDISAAGVVRTVAGRSAATTAADRLNFPMGVAATGHGLVVSDWGTSRLLAVDPHGATRVLAGNGQAGFCGLGTTATGDLGNPADLAGGGLARNNAFLTGADLGYAADAVTDSHGITYAAIPNYGVVVRIDPDGTVTRVVGQPRSCRTAPPLYSGLTLGCPPPASGAGDGGRADAAVLTDPEHLLLDQFDNLYISDGGEVRYVNFSDRTVRPQGRTVKPGTIATVYRHAVKRLHVPLFSVTRPCQDFCNTYLDGILGLGAMTLDPRRGTLFVVDQLDQQVVAVTFCGPSYLVAGRAATLVSQVSGLLGVRPPPAPLADGSPAYNVDILPSALAFDRHRDLLLMTDAWSGAGPTASGGRVLAVNVGTKPVDIWGTPLLPRAIMTYAGGAGCADSGTCSYGDGSHARNAAFELPFGLAIADNGAVFVAEISNRVRRVGVDGVVGTVAGVSRDMYDGFAFGSAAGVWWWLGGECADGGAATTACFSGLHTLHTDAAGALVATDVISGRVRQITHAMTAPLRPDAAPIRGAGWAFTPSVRLPNFGHESTDSSLAVDSQGHVYAMAPMLGGQPALFGGGDFGLPSLTVPCAVWSYTLDADGHGHDAPAYLGEPDANFATTSGSTRTCSLAASPPGGTALTPPPGAADRLVFGSGGVIAGFTPTNTVAGASRDGAHTFLSSPNAALTTTAMADIDSPSVVALDGDTSGMTFQDSDDGVVDFALSRGGTQYVQLTRVVDTGVHDFTSPSRMSSTPARAGNDLLVPAFPTTMTGCQRLLAGFATCTAGFDTSRTTLEVIRSTNRGLNWGSPTVLRDLACRNNGLWTAEAYCWGYHGTMQLAVDAGGTYYAVWDDGHHVVLSHSADGGATWTSPTRVDSGVPNAGYPAIVAGDKGRVAVAFYGSTAQGRDIATPDHQWWAYLAQSSDANTARPRFAQSLVSHSSLHEGGLCQTAGAFCGIFGGSGPAEAGSGIQVAMDPRSGHVIVAVSESRGVLDDGNTAGVVVTRQCTGPSLLVHPVARPCSRTAPEQATLQPERCAPQGVDRLGDAVWSGANRDALDLHRLGFQVSARTLTMTMDVAGYSTVPPAGATGTAWTVSWRSRGVRYFARATSPSIGDPTSPSTDASAPTMSYRWGTVSGSGEEVPAGSATGHVSGNSIVMSVPATDVGSLDPGTLLTDLRAESRVLTGGVADVAAGTWTTVDRLAASYGYDPGLRCTSATTSATTSPQSGTSKTPRVAPLARGRAADPTPLPSIDPSPSVSVSPPTLLDPGPPDIPICGIVPPPVPLPTPTALPTTPTRPRFRALVPPLVLRPHLEDGGPPNRAVAIPQPPPQAQAEAPQPASQPLSQMAGAADPQEDAQHDLALATEGGRTSSGEDAAWLLAAATLTMAAAGALRYRRRGAAAYETERRS